MAVTDRLSTTQKLRIKNVIAPAIQTNLDRLGRLYGTDKRADSHGYTRHYQHHLAPTRRQVRSVLEIGVARGESLRMWAAYFPTAHILGLDLEPPDLHADRITTVTGDQTDPAALDRLVTLGAPFDLIVDDGSHRAGDATITFRHLIRHVRPGGFYAIEDLATAYDPQFGGGPLGTPGTSLELLRDSLDATQGHGEPAIELHLYRELAIMRRI